MNTQVPSANFSTRIGEFISSFSDRAIIYLFPLFLVLVELVLRAGFGIDARAFIGPSLASIGVGFVLPLTIWKGFVDESQLPENTPDDVKKAIASLPRQQFVIVSKGRKAFASWCLIFTIVLTSFWLGALYFSTKSPETNWLNLPVYNWLGFISYFSGFILSEVREGIR